MLAYVTGCEPSNRPGNNSRFSFSLGQQQISLTLSLSLTFGWLSYGLNRWSNWRRLWNTANAFLWLYFLHRIPKKVSHLMFDNNFGKCGPFFKILSPSDMQENSLCTYGKDFHLACNMLLHYLVEVENPKMLPNFHVERDNMLPQKISH